MKRENYKDSLEEVFSERFHESPDANETWSLPSEGAWDAIADQLPSEHKKRAIIWWLWLGLGVLTILGIAVLLMASKQHETVSTNSMLDYVASSNEIVQVESKALLENSDAAIEPSNKTIIRNSKAVITQTTRTIDIVQKSEIVAELEQRKNDISVAVPTDSEESLSIENLVAHVPNLERTSALLPIEQEEKAAIVPLHTFEEKQKEITRSSRKVQIESVVAASRGIDKYALSTNDLSLSIDAANTFKYGVQAEYLVSDNWLVGAGLLHSNVQFDSDYAFDLTYESNSELAVDQGFASLYSRDLPSLANEFQTNVVLVRDVGNVVAPETDIPVELSLAHDISYLSVPVYVQYQERKGKWTYYLKSGVSADFRLKELATKHLYTDSMHDAFQHHNSDIVTQKSIEGRRMTIDYLGAVGVQRHLNKQFYLYAEPNVAVSLLSTYPRIAGQARGIAMGGQMGLGFSF